MNDGLPAAGPSSETSLPADASGRGQTGTGLTIARNSLWMMADTLGGFVASFYCSITVARSLGPDVMGQYNYVLYFATVLRMVADVALPATVRKYTAELVGRGEYATVRTLVRQALRLQTKLAAAGLTVGFAIVLATFPVEQRPVAMLAVAGILPAMLLTTPAGALAATENVSQVVVSSLASTAANLLGVTVSLLMGWGLMGVIASLVLSRVVNCGLLFAFFQRVYARLPGKGLAGTLDPALRGRMVRFAAHQLLLVLLWVLLFDRVEVFFLKSLAPEREIAFFSISFTLVFYLLQIPMNMASSTGVSVWVQQGRAPEEAARTTVTATWFVMLVATPVMFGVAAVSDPLVRLLYGARYLPAIPVLTALSILSLGLAVSQPAQFLLVGAERQRFYLASLGAAGAVSVVANLVLIPTHGAMGAAVAKGAGGLVGAVSFLTYLVVGFGAKLPYGRMARLLVASGAMFVAVRAVGRWLPSLLALLVGIPLGVATFVVLTRWLQCLDAADRARLRQLERLLPARARGSYLAVVDFLAPARSVDAA
jgi:O-antigen/teichoic acid export membrane protein